VSGPDPAGSGLPGSATEPAGRRTPLRWGLAGIAAAALLAYANALPNEFVWDDVAVRGNPFLRDPGNLAASFTRSYWEAAGTTLGAGHYRPMVTASYVLSYQLTGDSPSGYRAVNLLLHAATAVLVAVIALELGLATPFALVAGLLFALHPVNTETVAWIVGRAELGASSFAALALLLSLRARRRGRALTAAAGVALLLGLLFKESAAAAVGIAAALHLVVAEGTLRARVGSAALHATPLAFAVVAYLAIRHVAVGTGRYEDLWFFAGTPGWQVLLTMAKVLAFYFWLLLAPFRLRAHYDLADFPVPVSFLDPAALAALALHAAVVGLVLVGLVRRSLAAAFAGWILAALVPFLHVVPFQWLMAERFLYLATAGWALLLARGAERLAPWFDAWPAGRATTAIALAVLAVVVFAPRTILRNRDWRDGITFFTRMVEQTPDLIGARLNLSGALGERGRHAEAAAQLRVAYRLGYRPAMVPVVPPNPPRERPREPRP